MKRRKRNAVQFSIPPSRGKKLYGTALTALTVLNVKNEVMSWAT